MKFFYLFVILLVTCEISLASRILFLFPSPSNSHLIVVQGLSTTLAERGHDVTVISPFPLTKPMKNYRDIKSPLTEEGATIAVDSIKNPNQSKLKLISKVIGVASDMGIKMLEMQEFKRIMKEEKFDLVIIGMFLNDYLLGVGDHFKCPTIMLSVNSATTITNLLFGNPFGVSSVRHLFSEQGSGKMTFIERTINFMLHGIDLAMFQYLHYAEKQIYE